MGLPRPVAPSGLAVVRDGRRGDGADASLAPVTDARRGVTPTGAPDAARPTTVLVGTLAAVGL